MAEPAAAYRDSALRICRLAAAAALARGDDETLRNAAGAGAALAENSQSEAYRWAWDTADLVSDGEMKQELRAQIESFGGNSIPPLPTIRSKFRRSRASTRAWQLGWELTSRPVMTESPRLSDSPENAGVGRFDSVPGQELRGRSSEPVRIYCGRCVSVAVSVRPAKTWRFLSDRVGPSRPQCIAEADTSQKTKD